MNPVSFLIDRFRQNSEKTALVWKDQSFSYQRLLDLYSSTNEFLDEHRVPRNSVVALEADFSPASVAALLALIERAAVVVPLTSSVREKRLEFLEIAEVQFSLIVDDQGNLSLEKRSQEVTHPLLKNLRGRDHAGLILFSSGTTGKSKAALHDFHGLLEKFHVPRHSKVMISFLLFDHIGGLNTLLYCLSNAGTLVTVQDRTPETVIGAIEKHRVEVLPTSPTFLNLLLMSENLKDRDLGSLELITYGTEPMPESTLLRTHQAFPSAKLQQTYGLSELGILRSKSKSNDSLWIKVGGEGFETRVINGLLEIKAKSAMLGYLNAPSPFTEDGWFKTGDLVEQDGEYLRILGRKSDLINVGGEKVYPSEVESLLLSLEGVEDAIVNSEAHPLVGQIVVAYVRLKNQESLPEFRQRMRKTLVDRGVPSFKIPQKITIADDRFYNDRFKKLREIR